MSKAVVLPVNILVIVAVATIASLGLVSVYGVGSNPFSSAMGIESAKNLACRQLTFGGCKGVTNTITVKYDSNKDGNIDASDNLLDLCKNFLGRPDDKSCRQLCGCVGSTTSTGSSLTDFIVSMNSPSDTITVGSSATPTANVGGVSTAPITLSIAGCPAGATCSFSANNRVPPFSSVLTIANAAVGGPYAMTITGTNGTRTKTASYSLTVNAVGGFTFTTTVTPSSDPATQGTPFGRTAAITVTRTSAAGTEKQVVVTSSGTITNGMVISSFVPCTPNPTCSGALTVSTGATTPAGTYTIIVTGTSGASTSSANYVLTVSSPGCTCSPWVNGACGAGGCDVTQRQQTRTCNPPACQAESQCFNDPACACVPTTCAALGKNCGNWPDGCSGTLNCGTCPGSEICVNGVCTPAVCSCSWENAACGGGGCTIFVFWCGQWQRCRCNIPNCGTCGGSPEGALFCNTGLACGLVGIDWIFKR